VYRSLFRLSFIGEFGGFTTTSIFRQVFLFLMIHDFATAPRTPKEPVRVQVQRPVAQKMGRKLPFVLLLGMLIAFAAWQVRSPGNQVEAIQYPIEEAKTEYLQAATTEESLMQGPEASVVAEDESMLATKIESTIGSKVPEDSVAEAPEETFGFYDSLQESSWRVPVQRGIYLTEEDRKRATYRYVLQAASLRNRTEAAALVARLKERGLNASYSVSGDSLTGSAWFRVNVGPFSNVSVMNKAEDMLVSMRMMPLKRRVR